MRDFPVSKELIGVVARIRCGHDKAIRRGRSAVMRIAVSHSARLEFPQHEAEIGPHRRPIAYPEPCPHGLVAQSGRMSRDDGGSARAEDRRRMP